MTESAFTSRLLTKLRQHPQLIEAKAVVWKHANVYVKGVPDFSVTIGARTTWWEVKRYGERPTEIQQYYLDRIGEAGAAVITVSRDWRGGFVSYCERAGVLTIAELVEEVVTRSLPL